MKKYVNVTFADPNATFSKVYAFVSYVEPNLTPGDMVVVNTVNGFSLANVIAVSDEPLTDIKALKEVVCKLNVAPYLERQEKLRQAEKLKREMDAKVAYLQENAVYELLAEKDPELKEMLQKYSSLTSEI